MTLRWMFGVASIGRLSVDLVRDLVHTVDVTVVNIHEAKTHFSKLLRRVMAGERIIIAKAGKPVAELGPISEKPKKRPMGMDKGLVLIGPDFDDPLPELDELT